MSSINHPAVRTVMAATKKMIASSLPALMVCAAFFFASAYYAHTHFYRDPGSFFFDAQRANERHYSLQRELETESFLRAHQNNQSESREGSNVMMCATFVTVFRPQVDRQYTFQALGSLLANITTQERSALHLAVLFADHDPTQNPPFGTSWFTDLSDAILTYHTLEKDLEIDDDNWRWISEGTIDQKSIMDYTLALQYCLKKSSAPYIAVFEDDILFADGWLIKALTGLQEADVVSARQRGSKDSWLDLRTFNQERSIGFASHAIGGNNEALISAAISIPIMLGLFLLRRNIPRFRAHVNPSTILIVTVVAIPSFIVLFYQCGKASVLPPRPGVFVENFGCCSQALIFNRVHAEALIQYLRRRAQNPDGMRYDMMTKDFANQERLSRMAMYPMLVQHMGFRSASGTHADEARKVWSMAFEDLQKNVLAREHRESVDQFFGHTGA